MRPTGTQWNQGFGNTMFSNGVDGESSLEVKPRKGRYHADAAVFTDHGDGTTDTRAQADYRTPYRAQKAAEGFEQRLMAGKPLPGRVDSYSR